MRLYRTKVWAVERRPHKSPASARVPRGEVMMVFSLRVEANEYYEWAKKVFLNANVYLVSIYSWMPHLEVEENNAKSAIADTTTYGVGKGRR